MSNLQNENPYYLIELILSVASGTQSDSDILQWLQQHII